LIPIVGYDRAEKLWSANDALQRKTEGNELSDLARIARGVGALPEQDQETGWNGAQDQLVADGRLRPDHRITFHPGLLKEINDKSLTPEQYASATTAAANAKTARDAESRLQAQQDAALPGTLADSLVKQRAEFVPRLMAAISVDSYTREY